MPEVHRTGESNGSCSHERYEGDPGLDGVTSLVEEMQLSGEVQGEEP